MASGGITYGVASPEMPSTEIDGRLHVQHVVVSLVPSLIAVKAVI